MNLSEVMGQQSAVWGMWTDERPKPLPAGVTLRTAPAFSKASCVSVLTLPPLLPEDRRDIFNILEGLEIKV